MSNTILQSKKLQNKRKFKIKSESKEEINKNKNKNKNKVSQVHHNTIGWNGYQQ